MGSVELGGYRQELKRTLGSGVMLMVALSGAALLDLITAATILSAIIYGLAIVLYLAVRGRSDRRQGAFDLGRFELPVAIGSTSRRPATS